MMVVAKAGHRRNYFEKGTMKPSAHKTEKDLGKDLKSFEQLPAKTKELEILQHQLEKATGPENLALHKLIGEKSKPSGP